MTRPKYIPEEVWSTWLAEGLTDHMLKRKIVAYSPEQDTEASDPTDLGDIVIKPFESKPRAAIAKPTQKPRNYPDQAPKFAQRADAPTGDIPAESMELTDLRDWVEDVGDISGARIRNCILYMLDFKKDIWYSKVLSIGYIKRVRKDLGITGAQKLHEDTPPGWEPNPMLVTRAIPIGEGEEAMRTEIARAPKNAKEWDILHNMLVGPRGKVNPVILPYTAKKDCKHCHGRGGYNEKVHPELKGMRWQEFFRCPCDCCHVNPFK